MVELARSDILTTEVLDWKGVHLFHFSSSSCSQKVRIFLRLKGIHASLHHISLMKGENQKPWFMGINPRGLVPTLVHDGKVIIESNDILEYLEAQFPEPALIPVGRQDDVSQMLKFEDDLHMDLRSITMRFVLPSFMTMRKDEVLEAYRETGSGLVGGKTDPAKEKEIAFWKEMNVNKGITDEQIKTAVGNFHKAFNELEVRLMSNRFLLGDEISVIDIAWYIYTLRLQSAGYGLEHNHPKLYQWFNTLSAMPEFKSETQVPPPLKAISKILQITQSIKGTSFKKVAGV